MAHVSLKFDFHCNGTPFHAESSYSDGFGALVRFDRVRFVLIGAALRSDDGGLLCESPGITLMIDPLQPTASYDFCLPAGSEIHWLDTRTLASTDAVHGAADSMWATFGEGAFRAALDVQGVVDSNDNGVLDDSDSDFRIAVADDAANQALRVHAHAIAPATGACDLIVPVNIAAILHQIDLPDAPITMGHGPNASQAMTNLRTRVLGADNKPL